jgi:hypothetical protein
MRVMINRGLKRFRMESWLGHNHLLCICKIWRYASDITDDEWAFFEPRLPPRHKGRGDHGTFRD